MLNLVERKVTAGFKRLNTNLLVFVFLCFVRISEQTATFSLYTINWLAFITVVESVYSAVRTDSLHKADDV